MIALWKSDRLMGLAVFSLEVNLDVIEGFMACILVGVGWVFRRRKWTAKKWKNQSEVEKAVRHRASRHSMRKESPQRQRPRHPDVRPKMIWTRPKVTSKTALRSQMPMIVNTSVCM